MNKPDRLQEAIKQVHLSKQEVEDPRVSENLDQALDSLESALNHTEDELDAYQYLPEENK